MSTQTLTNFVFWSPKKVENSKPPIYISLRRGRGRFKIPQGTIKLSPHLSRGRVFHVKVNKKQNKMSNFLPTFTKFNQLIPIAFTHFYLFLSPSTNFYYLLSVFTNFYSSFAIFLYYFCPFSQHCTTFHQFFIYHQFLSTFYQLFTTSQEILLYLQPPFTNFSPSFTNILFKILQLYSKNS